MNKKVVKWIKRISVVTAAVAVLAFGIFISYQELYLPHLYNSVYNEGIEHPEMADSLAEELTDLCHPDMAIEVLSNAAEKGFTKSQIKLALYLEGYKNNYRKAAYWYLKAAQKGASDAQCEMGIHYLYSFGVKQNFTKALYWIRKSADNKNANGQYELGNLYLNGLAYYDLDYEHTDCRYVGNNTFRGYGNEDYKVSDRDLEMYLKHPKRVFLTPNLVKAKYYWTLSAKQGYSLAKDALEKVYE